MFKIDVFGRCKLGSSTESYRSYIIEHCNREKDAKCWAWVNLGRFGPVWSNGIVQERVGSAEIKQYNITNRPFADQNNKDGCC